MKQTNPENPDANDDAPLSEDGHPEADTADSDTFQTPDASVSEASADAADVPAAPAKKAQPQTDETIKETFESIIIAFILAFVFRAYVVEAFVIPTGSMAPTLLGAHYRVECEQCGYDFKINYSDSHRGSVDEHGRMITPPRAAGGSVCPMCRYKINMNKQARARPGDRILVHKYIYTLSEPRRWDVVVFKAPHQPNTNFIKRLVGLPNESIRLLDGNVYTQAEGEDTWKIARKGDALKVQRAVWQPIYHSQYVPRDNGALMGPGERLSANRWYIPWNANEGEWDFKQPRQYRYLGGEPGKISFDFHRSGRSELPTIYAYNQYEPAGYAHEIEDIRLALTVLPDSADTTISLSTETRLTGPTQTITAHVATDGKIKLTTTDPASDIEVELLAANGPPLKSEQATTIELWAVDQEIAIFIDGRRQLRYVYESELSEEQLISRPKPARFPEISVQLTGSGATLHQVELDRDLYYASSNPALAARGGLVRNAQGKVMADRVRPMTLNSDEYFCIGDNSPLSDDGRFWDPEPGPNRTGNHENVPPDALWVRQRYFSEDITDNSRDGIVPREMMMGRAFFVYFPAPFAWSEGGMRIIPNFADMRFIH